MSTAVLNHVYNHYLTTYAPKDITRYDTHKKSELRSVYTSIVKLNKDAPWYLPDKSKETRDFAVNLKENARTLHNTIASLGGLDRETILNKKVAFSSDEEILSASYLETDAANQPPSIKLEVVSLANGQENRGNYLPDKAVDLPPDTYSFDISINDLNYEFQFSIKEEDTNLNVQERLARLISKAGIGINAEVITHEGFSSLKLSSSTTGIPYGKDSIFQISDDHTSKTSGAVAYFGLDYVSTYPSNAHFLLNGEEQNVSANQFTIGGIYEINLHSVNTPGEEVTVGLKTDFDALPENLNTLLGSYNHFLKSVSEFSSKQLRNKQLANELNTLSSLYKSDMEILGVQTNEDGSLSLDTKTFENATLDTEVLDASLSSIKKFATTLLRKSDQISLDPMEYVNKTVVAYKNPGHSFSNPYITSSYSGMLFNSYC